MRRGAASAKPKAAEATRTLLSVNMQDGTWEMEVKNGLTTIACDTPKISGLAMGQRFTTGAATIDEARVSAGNGPQKAVAH